MRCSQREDGIILPFLTSTPCANKISRNPFLNTGTLSPILGPAVKKPRLQEQSRLTGRGIADSRPLGSTRRNTEELTGTRNLLSARKTSKSSIIPPLVIASSNSEDDDQNFPTSLRRRSKVSMRARSKQRPTVSSQSRQTTILEEISAENAKTSRRVSKADKILDEIVKESMRKSIHNVNIKSEESIEAFIDKVMKNKDTDVKSLPRASTKSATSKKSMVKAGEEKENIMTKIMKRGEVQISLVPNNQGISAKNGGTKKKVLTQINNRPTLPAKITTPNDLDWHAVNGQNGVSMVHIPPVTYVKLSPKCSISNSGPLLKCMLIIITEGHALVQLNGETTKVGPGTSITSSGSGFEILNTGLKKDLILVVF